MPNEFVSHDHAAWLQQHLDFMKKQKPKTYKDAPDKLSDFQRVVFNIVGIAGGGLYNDLISIETIKWNYGSGISMSWKNELATFDSNKLTLLVFLCHEARIRCQIDATGPKRLQVSFWPRKAEGSIGVRHPNLDEAVKDFRKWFKKDHLINYKEPQVDFTATCNRVIDGKLCGKVHSDKDPFQAATNAEQCDHGTKDTI